MAARRNTARHDPRLPRLDARGAPA